MKILIIGVDPDLKDYIHAPFKDCEIAVESFDLEKLMKPLKPSPKIILVGMPPDEISIGEFLKIMKDVYPDGLFYHISQISKKFDRKKILNSGFTEAFLMPIDRSNFETQMNEKLALLGLKSRVFRKVKVLDFKPDRVLDFSTYLYLAANDKYIKLSKAGDPIDQELVDKMKAHSVSSLSIPVEEMKEFYSYTATVLKNIAGNSKLSVTERAERLESSARELIVSIYSGNSGAPEEAKEAVSELQGIVKSYIAITSPPGTKDWYNHFVAMAAQSANTYSQASVTSTFAAMFAIGLGVKEVEDIAIAGLLHDLGMSKIPGGVLEAPAEHWIEADRQLYESHPEITIDILKSRKLIVSENVHKIILQHHENWCGSGFPKKAAGDGICIGAQLLAIADVFYEMTKVMPGRKTIKPPEAIDILLDKTLKNLGKEAHNPELLKKIAALFKQTD